MDDDQAQSIIDLLEKILCELEGISTGIEGLRQTVGSQSGIASTIREFSEHFHDLPANVTDMNYDLRYNVPQKLEQICDRLQTIEAELNR